LVRFITGHLKDGGVNLHWPELLDTQQTLVFYMGLVGLQAICEQLIAHGRNPHTPVALVEKGTTPAQRVIIATLATLNERVQAEQVRAPTLTIIGEVVRLHDKLKWN
jgi:uroporphyrin-III C-methyltransferase/precorrin-2 dehydrogenase/sirohydrochlorin ferrochelatase